VRLAAGPMQHPMSDLEVRGRRPSVASAPILPVRPGCRGIVDGALRHFRGGHGCRCSGGAPYGVGSVFGMSGLLAFHAHPDDESISSGGTLASLVARGVPVSVLTATRGEVGEIHNRPDAAEVRDRLGEIREAELRAALVTLGAGEPRFLEYRDSGMSGTADNDHPESFWRADFPEAVGRMVRVLREVRPDVVTAYDPFGGYGHPDHIQVHRVGTAAYWAAADTGRYPSSSHGDPWTPSKLYWTTWSRDRMVKVRRQMSGDLGSEEPAAGSLDTHITTTIDVEPWLDTKHRALLCHDTQFPADSWVRTLPPETLRSFIGFESLTLVHATVECDPADPDLMAGV
jgi:N-acetyl-1-D-myo-inositol-2-amino-2-deoxy-alpha-D-glucopyranoside deacetylase